MTLPVGRSSIRFYSQRADGRPYVNCYPYSICPLLGWMGYQLPLDADGASRYGMTLRIASGVPVAPGVGTGYADMKRAIAREGLSPVVFTSLEDKALLALLPKPAKRNRNKAVMSVVSRMHELSPHLRRLCGKSWVGNHGIALAGQRLDPTTGRQQVYWMDPMGKIGNGYSGEWVDWNAVKNTLARNSGKVRVIYGVKKTAV